MRDRNHRTAIESQSIPSRPAPTPVYGESINRKDSTDPHRVERLADGRFPKGTRQRKDFDALCAAGCDPEILLSWLIVLSQRVVGPKTIYQVYGTSRSSLDKVSALLDKLSKEVESINPFISAYFDGALGQNPGLSNQIRSSARQQAAVYRVVPKLLRTLALDIQTSRKWANQNVGPRRLDTLRKSATELVWYVEVSTGSQHYEQVSELIEHVSLDDTLQKFGGDLARLQGGNTYKRKKSALPKFLTSPDALKALYLRSAKYGFLPSTR